MQIIDNSLEKFPHFFFQGYRVPESSASGPDAALVGVLAIKQTITAMGSISGDNLVLLTDEAYPNPTLIPPDPDFKPLRLESDMATTKPFLDIVVIRNDEDVPEFSPPPAPSLPSFGFATIDRLNVPPQNTPSLDFGWSPRTANPRLGDAGDQAALEVFPDSNHLLPVGFVNTYFNGSRNTGFSPLQTGDTVILTEGVFPGSTAGATYTVTVPEAATLIFKYYDEPLNPQPSVSYAVDTVLFDLLTDEFLITWRAVFQWEDRLELAKLEIS